MLLETTDLCEVFAIIYTYWLTKILDSF